MAYLYGDGFDHYGSDNALAMRKYSGFSLDTNPARARTGNSSLRVNNHATITLEQSLNSGIIGKAHLFPSLGSNLADQFQIGGGASFSIFYAGDGSIMIKRGQYNGQVLYQSPPNIIQVGTYLYVEIGFINLGDNTTIIIVVNNKVIDTVPNLSFSAGNIDQIMFTRDNSDNIDDYYEANFAGEEPFNSFLGDLRLRLRPETANGPNQDWAPNGDVNAWQCLNHIPTNPGVNFISSGTVGDISDFGITDLPTNIQYIAGYTVFAQGLKSDSGAGSIKFGLDSQGDLAMSADTPLGTNDLVYVFSGTNDPHTGGNFNLANAQLVLARVERTA